MTTKLPAYLKIVVILLGIILAVIVMIEAKSVLVPLLISGLLAVLISPLSAWLEIRKVPKVLSVLISVVALLGFLLLLIYFFYNQLLGFASDLHLIESRLAELVDDINKFLDRNFEGAVPISMTQIKDASINYLSSNVMTLTQGIMATAATLTMLFIIPVYIFLFLYYRHFLVSFVLMAFGDNNKDKVNNAIQKVKLVIKNYIAGMFLVICILAVLNTVMLYSFGIKYAILFGLFAAFLNIIPFLGPFIGSALPILFALLTKDSLWYPVGVFLGFYVIQMFESNLFTPRIVGGRVSMNPLMTIIALFVGNFIWGLAGMILFIPGLAILKVVFDEVPGMEPYGYLLGNVNAMKRLEARKSIKDKIKMYKSKLYRRK